MKSIQIDENMICSEDVAEAFWELCKEAMETGHGRM